MAGGEDETQETLRELIERANGADAIRKAREELICLCEADDWEVQEPALAEGIPLLRRMGVRFASRAALVRYILDLLKSDYPMHAVGLGEPPGCNGIGYVMNNSDGRGLYIKVTIEEEKKVLVMSFKTSKHYKGG
jgi:hypothetical protein